MAWNPLEHLQPVPQKPICKFPKLLKKFSTPYVIIGGYAVQQFIPERDCYRLDLLIETRHREEVLKFFKKNSSHQDCFADTHDFFILKRRKIYLGVINSPDNWVPEAIKQSSHAPLPWLIFTKMWAGGRQDFLDAARLIARANTKDFDQVKTIFEKYNPRALSELRELYKFGKAELDNNPTYHNKPNSYSAWHKINAEVEID